MRLKKYALFGLSVRLYLPNFMGIPYLGIEIKIILDVSKFSSLYVLDFIDMFLGGHQTEELANNIHCI